MELDYNVIQQNKTQHNSQCIHVANGSSRHYGVGHSFLELPERRKNTEAILKTRHSMGKTSEDAQYNITQYIV